MGNVSSRNGREVQRKVFLNNDLGNKDRCKEVHGSFNNYVSTSKYSLLSFVPRNLFEQLQRVANAYFVFLLVLQLIPAISSLSPITTAVPLAFVLMVTMIKDGLDDKKRHDSDRKVNNSICQVLMNGIWEKVTWSNLKVGQIVQLRSDEAVPADMILISSSTEVGSCFVETAELDGETNLKVKNSLPATRAIVSVADLGAMHAEINCEAPNNKLHRFEGTFKLREELSLNNDCLLLRGCTIRNTAFAMGVVVFAGRDTKLMQNSGAAHFKRTHIDQLMNKFVLTIFVILFLICMTCAILCAWWEKTYGDSFTIYLSRSDTSNTTLIAFYQFFSYIIILNTLVPISLYVSVELIRLGQSFFINWDLKMYHAENDTPAMARSTTLNEELGQIDYVFSDKTGTLTQNVMNFLKCTIGGEIYGKDSEPNSVYKGFVCDKLQGELEKKNKGVDAFFRLLSLCHTVQPETKNGKVVYQAESPDEKALADAAREAGFVFDSRTSNTITIKAYGETLTYDLMNLIEFNSTRKRMTVVLRRPDGKFMAYCKGADNVIYARLNAKSIPASKIMSGQLSTFAKIGLRTLVLAQRELDPAFYADWSVRYAKAECELKDREEKVALVAEELEKEFDLVGASAIEDQLQVKVPETIANLKLAKIKVWVLTGDKQETAINIGYSCKLLTKEMEPLFIINGETTEEVKEQMLAAWAEIKPTIGKVHRPYGLVIDGPTLTYPLPPEASELKATIVDSSGQTVSKWTTSSLAKQLELENLFVDISGECPGVVCCRVSPLQKSQVVRLIKRRKNAICLAIGDGANDVSMIKAAHVGIGISGLEGRQAVLASDFSIAQFRFLERLLLVHGRWSYMRLCSFLRYFFYKNFSFTLVNFWFAFFCAYSALTIYDPIFITLFNVIFTSLPIIFLGIFEQDVSDKDCILYPGLYEAGLKNSLFSFNAFLQSLFKGFYHSIVIFFVPFCCYYNGGQLGADGQTLNDFYSRGTVTSCILIFVVTLTLVMDIKSWNYLLVLTVAVGPSVWLIMFGLLYAWRNQLFLYTSEYYGTFNHVFSSQTFWPIFFVCVVLCNLPLIIMQYWNFRFRPSPTDVVRREVANRKDGDEVTQQTKAPGLTAYSRDAKGIESFHMTAGAS